MISSNKRYVIVYNGEIYNYLQLRNALKKIEFKTQSDTEVLLELISTLGLEKAVAKLNGIFAFAIWDRKKKSYLFAEIELELNQFIFTEINIHLLFLQK